MSKLDQIKALGAANRARKSSDGGVESRHASPHEHGDARRDAGSKAKPNSARLLARVAPGPSETKLKRGRPKVQGPRPWEVEGMSRRTWYRRQKEKAK